MSTNRRKEGIALVMVLGFLALLIISAVSFSVLMRTERLATRNYVDVVKARNLMHLALARAMEDIDIQLAQGGLLVAPPAAVLQSTETASGRTITDLLTDEARAYIPPALVSDADNAANALPWITINDPVNDQVIGRYAFIAVDSAGFLDANIVSGSGSGYGVDPRDIRYDVIPELPMNFPVTRSNNWVRFETLPELNTAASGSPDHTFVYSRFPNRYLDENDVARPRVYIGGDPAVTNWNETAIKAALQGLVPDLDMFYEVMRDYAGSSYAPLDGEPGLSRINARRVPMINEVIVTNSLEWVYGGGVDPDRIRHRVHINVETWYPYPQDSETFTLHIEGVNVRTTFVPNGQNVDPIGPSAVPVTLVPHDYSVTQMVFRVPAVMVNDPLAFDVGVEWPLSPSPGYVVQVEIDRIEIRRGSDVVDRVGPFRASPPDRSAFQFSSGPPFNMGLPELTSMVSDDTGWVGWPDEPVSREAIDPRINWNPGQAAGQWVLGNPPTPGARNSELQRRIDTGQVDEWEVGNSDREGLLYSNRQQGQGFRSVGELSYLLYDEQKPWTTVRLLVNQDFPDPNNPRELFDRLTLHPTNRPATFGLVNPNTWSPRVLQVVLESARVEGYPNEGGDDPDGLSSADAQTMANFLFDLRENSMPNEVFRVRSDMLNLVLPAAANNKFLAESPLRNSIDLFDTQQNLFTLLLAVQATTDSAANPRALAEQRAVAVVWRDPYPDSDGRHLSFVRYFRWLSE